MPDDLNRSYVDLFSNNSVIRGLNNLAAFRSIIHDQRYPRESLPQFLHESTHHWCFRSPVCTAMAFLRASAARNIMRGEKPGADLKWARDCLARLSVMESFIRPLAEGIALFAEFDVMPDHDSPIASIPSESAAMFFEGLDAFKENNATLGLQRLYFGLRTGSSVIDRKSMVLASPLNIEGDGYLAGYLALKTLWFASVQNYIRLADTELFFNFIRAYIFADFSLVSILLDRSIEGEAAVVKITEHFRDRLERLSDLPFSTVIPNFETETISNPGGTKEDSFSEPTPWDAESVQAQGIAALAGELHELRGVQCDEQDNRMSTIAHNMLARRSLMNIGMLEVDLVLDGGRIVVSKDNIELATADPIGLESCPLGSTGYLDLLLMPGYHFHVAAVTRNHKLIGVCSLSKAPAVIAKHMEDLVRSFSETSKTVRMLNAAIAQAQPMLGVDWLALQKRAVHYANELYGTIALFHAKDRDIAKEKMWEDGFWSLFDGDSSAIDVISRLSCWTSLRLVDATVDTLCRYHGFTLDSSMKALHELQKNCKFRFILSPPGVPPVFLA